MVGATLGPLAFILAFTFGLAAARFDARRQVLLFAVAALSLATMGYQAGLARTRRSLAVFAVAITFSVVIELIADLDRPQQGVLRVSQHALLDLQRSMNSQ